MSKCLPNTDINYGIYIELDCREVGGKRESQR